MKVPFSPTPFSLPPFPIPFFLEKKLMFYVKNKIKHLKIKVGHVINFQCFINESKFNLILVLNSVKNNIFLVHNIMRSRFLLDGNPRNQFKRASKRKETYIHWCFSSQWRLKRPKRNSSSLDPYFSSIPNLSILFFLHLLGA